MCYVEPVFSNKGLGKDKRQTCTDSFLIAYLAKIQSMTKKKKKSENSSLHFFNIKFLLYTKIFCWELTEFHNLYINIFMFGYVYCENISCEKGGF